MSTYLHRVHCKAYVVYVALSQHVVHFIYSYNYSLQLQTGTAGCPNDNFFLSTKTEKYVIA